MNYLKKILFIPANIALLYAGISHAKPVRTYRAALIWYALFILLSYIVYIGC